MAALTRHKCYLHNKTGSTIAELPPSLLLLLIIVFFPLLNLIYLFVAYCAGWYLNQIEARQISFQAPLVGVTGNQSTSSGITTTTYSNSSACYPNNSAQTALSQSQNWNSFMGVTEAADSPQVIYMPIVVNGVAQSQAGQAQVTTNVSIKPFLSQTPPWLPNVPGLTGPFNCSYTDTIFQEEQATPAAVMNNGNN
jgi:hypothetical protein